MTLEELKIILEATGLPVAFSHFTESENEPFPAPPFITYLVTYSSHLIADNKVFKKIDNVQIELYTDRKSLEVEAVLEAILIENEIPFATTEANIEDEMLYQKIYEVRLL